MPPFTGVAVNVTAVPGQIVVVDALAETDDVTVGLTVIVIELLVTKAAEKHPADGVTVKLTTSPVARVVEANVLLLVPTLTPLSCHW